MSGKPSLRALCSAYAANLGRQPTDAEALEFDHKFGASDLALLRRAIDEYFASTPRYPVLSELHAAYRRIAPSRAPIDDAQRWLNGRCPALAGFRFEGGETAARRPAEVKAAVLQHQDAWLDHDLATMARFQRELAAAGWAYARQSDAQLEAPDPGEVERRAWALEVRGSIKGPARVLQMVRPSGHQNAP